MNGEHRDEFPLPLHNTLTMTRRTMTQWQRVGQRALTWVGESAAPRENPKSASGTQRPCQRQHVSRPPTQARQWRQRWPGAEEAESRAIGRPALTHHRARLPGAAAQKCLRHPQLARLPRHRLRTDLPRNTGSARTRAPSAIGAHDPHRAAQ